ALAVFARLHGSAVGVGSLHRGDRHGGQRVGADLIAQAVADHDGVRSVGRQVVDEAVGADAAEVVIQVRAGGAVDDELGDKARVGGTGFADRNVQRAAGRAANRIHVEVADVDRAGLVLAGLERATVRVA